jgi:PKD repeat protein
LVAILAVSLGLTFAAGSAFAQLAGGLNLQFSASPTTQQAGQPVTFSYTATPPAVAPPFASITSVAIDFGDGQTGTGNTGSNGQQVTGTITHAYASPGVYTATLSAQASNGGHSSTTTSVTIQGSAPPPGPGVRVTYGAGWNLIGLPDGSILPSTASPTLYTWQAGATAYQSAATTQAGKGYWAFLTGDASASLTPTTSPSPMRITLPPGQWIMIGNPYSNAATVSGADAVFVYDPSNGYRSVSTLQPGLGAWAFSSVGGTAVITSTP